MDTEISFGLWLEKRRKALDLTRDELAQRIGYSPSALRKIESDERRPSKQLAEQLARALDIPVEEHSKFIRIARGEFSIERLKALSPSPVNNLPQTSKTFFKPIPIPLTPLVGREMELAALAHMLEDPQCRLITLVGPGGIGKTRLAIETASVQNARHADGAHFVSLASLNSLDFIIPTINETLGLLSYGPVDPKKQLFSYLNERALLLVLDNIEHLLEGGNLLAEILECAPHVKLLVTSRERLNLQGEWVFDVHGLSMPSESLDEMESYSALTLFVALVQRVRNDFSLNEKNRASVVRICRAVNGIPLGIELAAAWVRVLTCSEIAEQIELNLDFLATTRRDIPERHRSLRAAFDHSWELLSEDEKDALRRLSVFRGGFLRDAAEYVAGASLTLLSSLISKSLILRTEAGRYDVHELVRQFASAHLETDSDEFQSDQKGSRVFETHRAHANYYLALAEEAEAELFGVQQAAWKERLEQEHDNLRAALEWLLKSDGSDASWKVEVMLRIAGPLHRFWHGRHGNEGRHWLERGVAVEAALAVRVPAAVRIKALETASRLAEMQNDYGAAFTMLQEALTLSRETQKPDAIANVLDSLGDLAWLQGDFVQAHAFYEECLELRKPGGNPSKIALALISLGNAVVEIGDYTRAQRNYEEGLALCREAGDLRGIAMALYGLGLVAVERNESAYATLQLKEALKLFDHLQNDFDVALCLECLAYVAVTQGRAAEGALLWGANETLFESLRISLFGNYQVRRERGMETACNQVGEPTFKAALAQGRAMGWEQAVAVALAE